jgi:hypothetical protein
MAGNTLTLTIAGDSSSAEGAFNRVGAASEDMGRKVHQSGDAFDRAAERADNVDTKAMGFRDTLTGIQDGTEGVKRAAAGDWGFETLLLLGTGVGDLASGLFNFLIPATKSMRTAQLGLNTAFLTSPLTWIIVGIAALIAIIVLIATKTDWFQRGWRAAWGWIKRSAGDAWDWVKSKAIAVWNWMQGIPGRLRTAFSRVASIISAPYRAAFNLIARAWNNTIGRLSWTVPSWVPGIGGNSISVPNLPTFHAGGTVPGFPGQAVPIMAMAGERVSATGQADAGGWVVIRGDAVIDDLIEAIARRVDRKGGRAAQLGIRFV